MMRPSGPDSRLRNHGPLVPEDLELISKLTPLLQIAHSLDRSRAGVVTHVRAELSPGLCELKVFGPQKRDLEISDAARHAPAFEQEYGVKLMVVAG